MYKRQGQDAPDTFDEDFLDDEVEPVSVPSARYKRRIEPPGHSSRSANRMTWVFVGLVLAAVVGLVLWLQPWKSTPLDVVSVQNERVELTEFPGADGCFWRFDVEIANTTNEQVWITGVEVFLNDQIQRPCLLYTSPSPRD